MTLFLVMFFPKKLGVAFDYPRFCSEKNTCRHHIFPGGDMTGQEVIFTMLLRMIIPGPSSTHNPINPLFFLRVEKLATNFLRLPEVVLKISDMAQIPGKKQGNEHDSQSGTPNWFSKTSCLAENDELKSFINYPVRLVRDRLILLMVQKSFTS